jgi:hypothetical protein
MRKSIYRGIMEFKAENTEYVIKYIKGNDTLLRRMRGTPKNELQKEAFRWASEHGNEFGNRFETELYDVFWDEVYDAIKTSK